MILNPSCSEAVFRFRTLDPKKIRAILQAISDTVASVYEETPTQVPLYKRAEGYAGKGLLQACAGLGEQNSVITIERANNAFVLNIGNNDISGDNAGWTDVVKRFGIKVEEATYSPLLDEAYSRGCTCGQTFFDGYKGLIDRRKFCPNCDRQLRLNTDKKVWYCECGDERRYTRKLSAQEKKELRRRAGA